MRLDGWERRLDAWLEAARHRPYAIGEHDCFRLVCGAMEALTGVNRWAEFAGYRTERESIAVIARHGRSFEAAFDWFFGAPSVDPRLARRGDACYALSADGGKPLGVCVGAESVFLGLQGWFAVPTRSCVRAWRVG